MVDFVIDFDKMSITKTKKDLTCECVYKNNRKNISFAKKSIII